jgi:hypothetical protein
VRNNPAHVLRYVDFPRRIVKQHEPVLAPAEQDGMTIPMVVCPIDGEECETLLVMANEIFHDHPRFKPEWRVQ